MRILFVIDTLAMGGAERLVVDTVAELSRRGHRCRIITLQQEGVLVAEARQYCAVDCLNISGAASLLSALPRYRRLVKRFAPQVVHAHLINSSLFSRLGRSGGYRLVNTYHSFHYYNAHEYYSKWRHKLDRATIHQPDVLISVSPSVYDNMVSTLGRTRGHVVLHNFASRKFCYSYTPKEEGCLKLLNVSNLRLPKNHGFVINFLHARPQLPVQVEVAGEGADRPQLERMIAEKGLRSIRLLGLQTVDSNFHNRYDAFFMSSLHEGMPVALIEALSSGLPAILPDLPMLRQTAGEAAYYYSTADELEEILNRLCGNKELLLQKSALAREVAKQYSLDRHVDCLLKLYEEGRG
ncbi:glycosyltransferase [Cesiribacter andamanensis]|uniref:Sugar transferase, PEP-CTERM/EpsH1 system associated n=1 Tax=Cesiribacter andamanensis AMV16 TaxID=1279009 RepID=M7N915_9BACT|nr:glycosyltransferase [Cesiribacter andamanensis]EMR03701.1 sugar transferase, PEP-CTERM/EpsH1 system associated [Cesiribacter andamanensis AMV16]